MYLFTEKLGKIKAVAKGSKSSKNKFFSNTLQLCFGEYMIFRGSNLYTLSEGKIINSFQGLLDDLEKLTYSTYLCELIDICMIEEDSNRVLFKDFVTALYLINTNAVDNEILIRAFELRLLKATGYGLDFDNITINISKAGFSALKFLNNTSLEKVYRLNLNREIRDEIYKVLSYIISTNYSRKPKSLDMLNFLKESETNV